MLMINTSTAQKCHLDHMQTERGQTTRHRLTCPNRMKWKSSMRIRQQIRYRVTLFTSLKYQALYHWKVTSKQQPNLLNQYIIRSTTIAPEQTVKLRVWKGLVCEVQPHRSKDTTWAMIWSKTACNCHPNLHDHLVQASATTNWNICQVIIFISYIETDSSGAEEEHIINRCVTERIQFQ
jgi:hypothetical protein